MKTSRTSANTVVRTQEKLILSNLNAKRDWGRAKDYVLGMWLMLQQQEPEDLVPATGETTTVRAFCEMAFNHLGIELKWEGEGINKKGIVDSIDEKQIEEATNLSASAFQRALPSSKSILSIFGLLKLRCYLVMRRKPNKNWAGSRNMLSMSW